MLQLLPDHFQNATQICQHIIIPESKNLESFCFQKGCSPFILFRSCVLTAIYFNNEKRLQAGEVHNIATNGMLAAKLEAFKAAVTQRIPKLALRIGHIAAQAARSAFPFSLGHRIFTENPATSARFFPRGPPH